jgi:PPK2 family polyphosphate:nucleotide phosphotransferase
MPIRLAALPTTAPEDADKRTAKAETARLAARIAELQTALYAERKRALLVVIQGMDASGKDTTVQAVFGDCNVVGLRPVSFKAPVGEELAHDFLWRVHRQAPPHGHIGIFIRSHYEDVVTAYVRGTIGAAQRKRRFAAINAFEKLLEDEGTRVVKLFLHLSFEEQEKELRERLETPEKHFKHNAADWDERKRWKQYQKAYETAFNACPGWHIVPADDGWYRKRQAAQIVAEALEAMNPQFPVLPSAETARFLKPRA